MAEKKPDFDMALTHLRNNQNMAAYNMFTSIASQIKKSDPLKAALSLILATECKSRQNKDSTEEAVEAGKLFFAYAKTKKDYSGKSAFLCAAKCFLKAGRYDAAKDAFEKSKGFKLQESAATRPVIIVDDSKAIVLKIKSHLSNLGYTNTESFYNGEDALAGCKKLLKQNPIILLDMGLPDTSGDVVASKILELKPDTQIILITADEKTTKRVRDTISSGALAFIQKPFTIKDLKDALATAESEYSLSKKQ
ncbi:MAG TPA: response regulator [Candidatus Nitrosotenuis sp.]|nr:response regulator [Candidatus Nitrosotenuis sp.]